MKKCAPLRSWCIYGKEKWRELTGSEGSAPPRLALLGAHKAWKGGEYSFRAARYIADHLNDGELWRLRMLPELNHAPSTPTGLVEAALGLSPTLFRKVWSAVIRPNPFARKRI